MKIFGLWNNNVKIGLTDKSDGNMRAIGRDADDVFENQGKALLQIGVAYENAARILADYDRADFTRYFMIDNVENFAMTSGGNIIVSDGVLTTRKNLPIFLPLADCLGVVLCDETNDGLMMIHAGRHNLEQSGLIKAVAFMTHKLNTKPSEIKAWFSPSAGKKNYPLYKFNGQSLQEVATEQLIDAGVKEQNIIKSDIDTTTDPDYFSHSTRDRTRRFAIMAILQPQNK